MTTPAAISVRIAPALVRKLVKSAPFIRRQIQRASKAEEAGERGADMERELLSDAFAENYTNAVDAIARTDAMASDFDRAGIILKTDTQLEAIGPISQLANAGVGVGLSIFDPYILESAATRAKDAATQAADRLDEAEAEIMATLALSALTAALPSVKFNAKAKAVAPIRRKYLAATSIAANRRKEKSS